MSEGMAGRVMSRETGPFGFLRLLEEIAFSVTYPLLLLLEDARFKESH